MMLTRRDGLRLAGAAAAAIAMPHVARAQAWPSRSIKAMVPFSAGSTIDIVGRIVLEPLAAQIGQPFVVENRGGAGGSIGSAVVAKADPDGYTVLVNASAHSAAPAAYPNLSYDASRDFAGVAVFGTIPNVTVIAPSKGIKTLKELVARAKEKPGSVSFGSSGPGSATHVAAERLRIAAGFKAVNVPFRGAEGLLEVVAGRVDYFCVGVSAALPHIQSGALIPLAVSTPKRSLALPNVPTTIEEGFPDSDYNYWMGMLAPAKTPRPIIDRLHQEIIKALQTPGVVQKFKVQGIEPLPLTPAEFDALIAKEIEINKAVVKAAG